ncbi:TetR/AcrR family transcriptional regulator [Leucobacter luti]|uniref:TetR family transcriptional regulator n=1 Tax=Leucobacter luti TaxID=340320 RepID=A0A4Q7U3X3_9MICO|nr:TetR family transcriptional regulator [Leucobacter luti]MBL3700732.1 TetR family transcriptional regulator [Leucobacter luti]RZT68431.1 TetR family transcriptional regulator [Leucobacter luti]
MDARNHPDAGSAKPRGALRRETIAEAAIELIEARGIEQLTMRALAAELGSGTMTLYTHVRSRDDLLAAVVQRLIAEMDIAGAVARAAGSWQAVVRATLDGYRQLATRFPRSFELLALAPYDEDPVASHLAHVVAEVERAGLPAADARFALGTADAFATGFLVVWARTATRAEDRAGTATRADDRARGGDAAAVEELRAPGMFDRGVDAVIRGIEAAL